MKSHPSTRSLLRRHLGTLGTCLLAIATGCVGSMGGTSERESGEPPALEADGGPFTPGSGSLDGGEGGDAGADPRDASNDDEPSKGSDSGSSEPSEDAGAGKPDDEAPDEEPTDPEPPVGAPAEAGNVTLVNVRGEKIKARFGLPAGSATTKHPAVVVLHGSGGLFKLPSSSDEKAGRTCSDQLESQFQRGLERLTKLGYVVIMPDSFGSRGYCDETKDSRRDKVLPPVSGDENGKTRRLLSRVYDLEAARSFLCAHPRVRCDRLGMVGFSNGGSAVMLGLHQKLGDTFAKFAASNTGKGLGVSIPKLPTQTLPFQVGVAYYPGCGFDGILSMNTDTSKVDEFYYPTIRTRILIGEEDELLPNCSATVSGEGRREIQARKYASLKGVPDRYDITVFPDAAHSFDKAGCETSTSSDPDTVACRESLEETLDLLAPLKAP